MLTLEPWQAFDFYKSFLRWYCDWYKPAYLEIGCASGELGVVLNTKRSVGVDINLHPDWDVYKSDRVTYYQMTSDEYFSSHDDTFDLVFIDGDHHEEQVHKDVANSLVHLNTHGLICMHDTWPPTHDHTHEAWCGTAYKVAQKLRNSNGRFEVYTFPVTYGLTLLGKIGNGFPWHD